MEKKTLNNGLYEYLLNEVNEKFEGWDFSHIESTRRMQEFPLRWNYRNIVKSKISESSSLLDMGTGGGEFLSSLSPLPKGTCATEGYEPNIIVAGKRLEPLGVKVYRVDDDESLPFEDESFDLIINRHESYSEREVYRLLKKQGNFITQQVGGLNDKEINEKVIPWQVPDFTVEKYFERLKEIGNLINKEGYIDFTCHRFLVIARKES